VRAQEGQLEGPALFVGCWAFCFFPVLPQFRRSFYDYSSASWATPLRRASTPQTCADNRSGGHWCLSTLLLPSRPVWANASARLPTFF
jgi:hypothetical protein